MSTSKDRTGALSAVAIELVALDYTTAPDDLIARAVSAAEDVVWNVLPVPSDGTQSRHKHLVAKLLAVIAADLHARALLTDAEAVEP